MGLAGLSEACTSDFNDLAVASWFPTAPLRSRYLFAVGCSSEMFSTLNVVILSVYFTLYYIIQFVVTSSALADLEFARLTIFSAVTRKCVMR